jgi:hypothetical protein
MIQQEDGGSDHLTPELCRHCSLHEQRSRRAQHGPILTFYNTILLWGVWSREVTLDTFVGAVSDKLRGGELSTIVSSQHPERTPDLKLCHNLDGCYNITLGHDELEPHVMGGVIHQQ